MTEKEFTELYKMVYAILTTENGDTIKCPEEGVMPNEVVLFNVNDVFYTFCFTAKRELVCGRINIMDQLSPLTREEMEIVFTEYVKAFEKKSGKKVKDLTLHSLSLN